MFPTGLPSPNPPSPAQEPRPAASDVHNDSSLTSSKKRKINSSEKEDIDSISSSPKAICNSSSTTSCSSTTSQKHNKKLRFEDSVDFIGLDVKMAEESSNPSASCSKAKNVFLPGGVGHHANGLTKSAGSSTFSNSKPGAAKKLVIKNFKGNVFNMSGLTSSYTCLFDSNP